MSVRIVTSVAVGLLMAGSAVPVAADVCAAPRNIQLDVLVDISETMQYSRNSEGRFVLDDWKTVAASELGSGVLHSFQSDRVLSAAGKMSIPTDYSRSLDVTPANIPEVERFLGYPGSLDYVAVQDLFAAIRRAGVHMGSLAGGGKVIIVLSHLGNTGGVTEATAVNALRDSGASIYLYYLGDPAISDDPHIGNSYASLQRIARSTGAHFSVITRSTSIPSFVDFVRREEGCDNWGPTARVAVTPTSLRLGDPGFTVTLDASASSDIETGPGGLTYHWSLTRPDGSPGPTSTGTGPAAAVFTPPAFTTADLGLWNWSVQVEDGDGARSPASGTFELLNSRPRIDLQGGGTIDVTEDLAVRTTISEDLDGGTLTYQWEQVSGPYVREDGGACWTCQELRWTTSAEDITVLSDDSPHASPWTFRLTVTDDEGAEESATVTVNVRNLPVPAEIDVSQTTLRVGQRAVLRSVENDDPDGGDVTRTWDIVQAPTGTTRAPSMTAGYDVSEAETIDFGPAVGDPGTWIFRLNLTDDEGEQTTDSVTIFVSAPPVADLDAPDQIGSLTDPLYLNGEASTDPDSTCGASRDWCHRNIEGPVTGITTPEITRWSWRVIDVPIEQRAAYRNGGLEDVLGVVADGPRVDLSPGTLPPGDWTFQLQVKDAEGDTDSKRVRVEVLDQSGDPVAVVTPPQRYNLDALNRPAAAVTVSGAGSIDPDNLGGAGPLPGIDAWHWTVDSGPPHCTATLHRRDAADRDTWTLFYADEAIDPECHGVWNLRLTVEDDDEPRAREASATTSVDLGNCPDPICVDYPVAGDPVLIRPGDEIDIPIFYHVDSGLRGSPRFQNGMAARLDILPAGGTGTPVYTAYSPNISSSEVGASLAFDWTGYQGVRAARYGLYDVRISLLDASGAALFSATQENAIAIAESEDVFDCGDLWRWGFPDERDGGAYPCVQYEEVPPPPTFARYAIYYPPYWDTLSPENPRFLRWTAEAARDSWATFSALGVVPDLAIVISPRPHPDRDEAETGAIAYAVDVEPGEPCPIVVYPNGLRVDGPDYRQLIAHEVAHCYQQHNIGHADENVDEDTWWIEGTAHFLSNLVYPRTNFEWHGTFAYDPSLPLYRHSEDTQPYATALFFQSLANDPAFGVPGLLRVLRALATDAGRADPAAVLTAIPGMKDAFHEFARDWYTSSPGGSLLDVGYVRWTRIVDTGGEYWPGGSGDELSPAGPPRTSIVVADGTHISPLGDSLPGFLSIDGNTIVGRYKPLTIFDVGVEFRSGYIYRLSALQDGSSGRLSLLRTPALAAWASLPAEVRPGCGSVVGPTMPILATDVSPATTGHTVRITITAERDPACG